jgi:phage terminase large subunit-like protein
MNQSHGTSTSFADQFRESFRQLSLSNQAKLIAACDTRELGAVNGWWDLYAHDHQREPIADWRTWLILGGRGAGKTRAGAEWVRAVAADPRARIALVGETEHDVREVMIEGVSGVLTVHSAGERPQWISTRRRLEWKNGAVAEAFSAEQPESLRGPQFSHAWCDELAKWRHADETAPINQWRSPREPVGHFATFSGFAN